MKRAKREERSGKSAPRNAYGNMEGLPSGEARGRTKRVRKRVNLPEHFTYPIQETATEAIEVSSASEVSKYLQKH